MSAELSETIIEWAATRPDEVVSEPSVNYYSYDIVLDAFEKGREIGMNHLKELVRKKYFNNAKVAAEALDKVLLSLSNKAYVPSKIFVNLSVGNVILLLTIDEHLYNSDEFIEVAYSEASKIQLDYHFKGNDIQINFLSDRKELNLSLLKDDGYGIGIDVKTNTPLYA